MRNIVWNRIRRLQCLGSTSRTVSYWVLLTLRYSAVNSITMTSDYIDNVDILHVPVRMDKLEYTTYRRDNYHMLSMLLQWQQCHPQILNQFHSHMSDGDHQHHHSKLGISSSHPTQLGKCSIFISLVGNVLAQCEILRVHWRINSIAWITILMPLK